MSRSGLAAALIGGAALAGYAALRVLRQEQLSTVVPLQRLSRKYRSRAGLVPAALGACVCVMLAVSFWGILGMLPACRSRMYVVYRMGACCIADARSWDTGRPHSPSPPPPALPCPPQVRSRAA